MAGGMGLLCMTDMAVAADHVIFGLPEVKVGVFPMQVMSLLQCIAPPRLVNEWALTGEPFDAKAALAAGLLNHVVPAAELDAKVDWLIGRIVDKSPTAIRRGKYAMRAIASMSFDESIAYTESQIALLAMTEDAKEGLKAFGEKRKPTWPGSADHPAFAFNPAASMPATAQISSLSDVSPLTPIGAEQFRAVLDQHAAGHRHQTALRHRIHRIDEIGLLLRALEQGPRAHAHAPARHRPCRARSRPASGWCRPAPR